MNIVSLVGRLTSDIELKSTPNGVSVCSFSLAVNRWDSKTKSEVTDWFNIDVWDKQAEFAGEYIKKGRLVAVYGRIQSNKWKDASGEERERYLIVANNVRLLGSKRDAE